MADQNPTLYPSGFNGTYSDFNKAKIDRSGALRLYKGTVAVPISTVYTTALIGLVPIRKGGYVAVNASSAWIEQLDTQSTTTATIGVTYNSSSTATSVPAQYVASTTAPQSGSNVLLNAVEGGNTYQFLDDGWITVTLAGSNTNKTGNITYSIAIAYDSGGLT